MVACHLLRRRLLAVFSWPVLLAIVWLVDGRMMFGASFYSERVNALVLIVVSRLLPAFVLAGAYLADE